MADFTPNPCKDSGYGKEVSDRVRLFMPKYVKIYVVAILSVVSYAVMIHGLTTILSHSNINKYKMAKKYEAGVAPLPRPEKVPS